jgi:hypothetical protein
LVPTMPAPMMTTRCNVVMLGLLWMESDSGLSVLDEIVERE